MTFPYPVLHEAKYDAENDVWYCEFCGWRRRIEGVPMRWVRLSEGDPYAHHEGAAGAPGACELGEMSGEVDR